MDFPDEECLEQTVERLTRENAKLRSQLAVAQQWNPPGDLEQAFRDARGWECLTVTPMPERPTLILISGAHPGEAPQDEAGEVWRHLQTAAPPSSRIGPFARARMPGRLLGYLREYGGQTLIVLNRDLRRGQVSRAARMLRAGAKQRSGPATRFLELSLVPILSVVTLLHGNVAHIGLPAAESPAPTAVLPAAIVGSVVWEATEPKPLPPRFRALPPGPAGGGETTRAWLRPYHPEF